MAKIIFEQMGGTYTMQSDYQLPKILLSEKEHSLGVWR